MTFSKDQLEAASAFAHTMIVVDDEPFTDLIEESPPSIVKTPKRGDTTDEAKGIDEKSKEPEAQRSHPLGAKDLVKSALDLGLVCSVVNPKGDEDEIAKSVAKAATRADIIALDWHMNSGDNGEFATEIIKGILLKDESIGGRLRLIAIYTGNKNKGKIFELILDRLNSSDEITDTISMDGNALVNSTGLRLVWREKAMGRANAGAAISELQLPKELLAEFSKLSTGLLANVALATVASLRDTTHHVLSKFQAELDGPFFHHRAFLQEPSDSMDYAVSIVLSALKSEVDKSQISSRYVSPEAIKRRLEAMKQSPNSFIFRYKKGKDEKEITLHLDEVVRIVTDGYAALSDVRQRKEMSGDLNTRMGQLPGKKMIRKSLSTLFSDSSASARASMLDFSFLTNTRSSELTKVHPTSQPKLDLGSVIHSEDTGYLLCLQATCDTVRGGSFFFVPLDKNEDSPDHIVPHRETGGKPNFVCLTVPKRCYTKSCTLNFKGVDPKVGHVTVKYEASDNSYHILDIDENKYRWLANLKYKRALRTAQNVSQEMSRVGFDEFAPFRK